MLKSEGFQSTAEIDELEQEKKQLLALREHHTSERSHFWGITFSQRFIA